MGKWLREGEREGKESRVRQGKERAIERDGDVAERILAGW